jgi:hypothetical protein
MYYDRRGVIWGKANSLGNTTIRESIRKRDAANQECRLERIRASTTILLEFIRE